MAPDRINGANQGFLLELIFFIAIFLGFNPHLYAECSTSNDQLLEEQPSYNQGNGIDPTYYKHFQEILLDKDSVITEVSVVVFRASENMDRDLIFSFYSVNGNHEPLAQVSGTEVVKPYNEIENSVQLVAFTLASPVSLSAGNYAIHLELADGSSTRGYYWMRIYNASDPYPDGISGYWYPYSSSWSTTQELDYAFRIYGCEVPHEPLRLRINNNSDATP